MKCRDDFVTNSSSSSFILSFRDEKEYEEFKESCNNYMYESLFELINNIREKDHCGFYDGHGNPISFEESRKQALSDLEKYHTWDQVQDYLDQKTKHISNFVEKLKEQDKLKESDEFKKFYDSLFVKRDFKETDDFIKKKMEEGLSFKEIIKSNEYRSLFTDIRENNNYFRAVKKLKEDQIIIKGTIWDTSGGLLEWAIRNGFLETEFYQWTDMVWNIG